jgi:hypothetical protein
MSESKIERIKRGDGTDAEIEFFPKDQPASVQFPQDDWEYVPNPESHVVEQIGGVNIRRIGRYVKREP